MQEGVIVSHNPYPTPGYLPYIVYTYDMIYDVVPGDPKSIFKAPYDSIIDAVIKSQMVGMGTLNSQVTPVPRDMVKDVFMQEYENNNAHPLKVALRYNDLWRGWVPNTHTRLFFCEADDQVSYLNAEYCYNKFMDQGGDPSLIKLFSVDPTLNHGDCAVPSMLLAKWFIDSIISVTPVEE